MKSTKHFAFIGMVITLIITSCSMEKRVYMSGYHLEWNKRKHNHDNQEFAGKLNIENKNHNNNEIVKKIETEANIAEQTLTRIEDNATASFDSKQIILPKHEKIIFSPSIKDKNTKDESKQSFKSEFKKGLTILQLEDNEPKTNGIATASMVLGILALITYYGAFLFGLLAIIFGANALKKIKSNPDMYKGKGMAKAGLICGIIAIGLILIIIAAA